MPSLQALWIWTYRSMWIVFVGCRLVVFVWAVVAKAHQKWRKQHWCSIFIGPLASSRSVRKTASVLSHRVLPTCSNLSLARWAPKYLARDEALGISSKVRAAGSHMKSRIGRSLSGAFSQFFSTPSRFFDIFRQWFEGFLHIHCLALRWHRGHHLGWKDSQELCREEARTCYHLRLLPPPNHMASLYVDKTWQHSVNSYVWIDDLYNIQYSIHIL